MRSTRAMWVFVLGLAGAMTSQAMAQDQAAQDATMQGQVAPVLPAHLDPAGRVEKPGVGPRLPEFVASIPLPVEAPAPAPSNNIVIPMTTVVIVLAVLVLILLID